MEDEREQEAKPATGEAGGIVPGAETVGEVAPAQEVARAIAAPEKRSLAEKAARYRKHLKLGRARREILAIEGWTNNEYRYVRHWLGGSFRYENADAFSDYLAGEQSRLEEIDAQIAEARVEAGLEPGERHRIVKDLHRLSFEVRQGIYEMAMKLGVLRKSAERVEVQEVVVGFGDEDGKLIQPHWPGADAETETVQ